MHWEPSSYDPNPNNWEKDTKFEDKSTDKGVFNTFNWPSSTWSDKTQTGTWTTDSSHIGDKWPSTTTSPDRVASWGGQSTPASSWGSQQQSNSWTTSSPPVQLWTTLNPTQPAKRQATKKSVLSPPSDPTKPLSESVTFSSTSWSGSSPFNTDLLSNVGSVGSVAHNQQPTRGQTTPSPTKAASWGGNQQKSWTTPRTKLTRGDDRKLEEQRDEIMNKNYFFTPSPTPLHVRDEKLSNMNLPNFQSEFTAFGSAEHKAVFDSFNTNFQTDLSNGVRPKKEIKGSDRSFTKAQNTYYHHGHHEAAPRQSDSYIPDHSKTLSKDHNKDIVQLYIPDPLAPGHPQGNGNHGWAPIEEWAKSQMNDALDTPDWANSEVFPHQNTVQDWSGKINHKPMTVQKWSSPAPVIFHSTTPSTFINPTQRSFDVSTPASYRSPNPTEFTINQHFKNQNPTLSNYKSPSQSQSFESASVTLSSYKKSSPTPSINLNPTARSFNSVTVTPFNSVTVTPKSYPKNPSTVKPDEVSTMGFPSPVTPLYHTNFGDYASLDVHHQSGKDFCTLHISKNNIYIIRAHRTSRTASVQHHSPI